MTNNRLEYAMFWHESTIYHVSEVANLCGYENDVHSCVNSKTVRKIKPRKKDPEIWVSVGVLPDCPTTNICKKFSNI
jgi:hypothetical protein